MSSTVAGHVKLGAYEGASLLLVRTVTPFHIGVGRTIGVVDLPIVRDSLGFPVIPTSSLKGALRSQLSEALGEGFVKMLFGPDVGEEAYTGALAFTEGYLLAMPVRSLRGVWALATSPVLVYRFQRMLRMMRSLEDSDELRALEQLAGRLLEESSGMDINQAIVCRKGEEKLSVEIMNRKSIIVNEEFQYECKQDESLREFFEKVKTPEAWRAILLHDDRIRNVIERSIIRRARVRLKKDKTVEEGPWSEEDVPADTLFFNVILYSKPRNPQKSQEKLENAEDVKNSVLKALFTDYDHRRGYTILGGHETIGRGVVELIGLAGCSP
jgi:CRISPR-associated protein Cmr4